MHRNSIVTFCSSMISKNRLKVIFHIDKRKVDYQNQNNWNRKLDDKSPELWNDFYEDFLSLSTMNSCKIFSRVSSLFICLFSYRLPHYINRKLEILPHSESRTNKRFNQNFLSKHTITQLSNWCIISQTGLNPIPLGIQKWAFL